MKLTIELVPSTSWYKNLRDKYTPSAWQSIAKEVQKKANFTCEICGRKKPEQLKRLYCHEVWAYDDKTNTQTLVGLQCLCFSCHLVKHLGYSQITDGIDYDSVVEHFLTVNNCTEEEFMEVQEEAFRVWKERSEIEWIIDFGKWD
ncbi:HNH endonuclease [Psychrobacillus sp. NPDC058041]|uniref:HNH endonuclease n=1 Tax=Psychrobacillus sp. NPDC058041 TaxID=3346310 RepID=UPI0036DFA286